MSAIRKTFLGTECDQDWDKLPVTEKGKHCELCNKCIIDFTGWDRKDMVAYYKVHPKTCGRFYPEQVVSSMVPVSDLFKRPRMLIAGILSFFGIQTVFSQQNQLPPVKIEQTSDTTALRNTPGDNLYMAAEEAEEEMFDDEGLRPANPSSRRITRTYVSTRFPFIHKRRRYATMGCPSF